MATHFSPKEGPHRLEVKNNPISIGDFLLDFPGGLSSKIFLILKYWKVTYPVKLELDISREGDNYIKKELSENINIGHQVFYSFFNCYFDILIIEQQPIDTSQMKRTVSGRQLFEPEESSSPINNKRNRYASPELPDLPLLEYSEVSTECDTPPPIFPFPQPILSPERPSSPPPPPPVLSSISSETTGKQIKREKNESLAEAAGTVVRRQSQRFK